MYCFTDHITNQVRIAQKVQSELCKMEMKEFVRFSFSEGPERTLDTVKIAIPPSYRTDGKSSVLHFPKGLLQPWHPLGIHQVKIKSHFKLHQSVKIKDGHALKGMLDTPRSRRQNVKMHLKIKQDIPAEGMSRIVDRLNQKLNHCKIQTR
ncbi:hypothetical protein [Marinoscillum furvescens]|uniref:Uncharacterized protein n=1 Tax=Marinoscillum furvescens DSM 4134 TaxID=1122208 RepID=A0A3D9L6E3_MARFU|nr:hypothetical protein [Marinoscillum furvescens]REE01727.1 hypothetical protein C7460_103244 [Marinoscillum furvescens DSM 4134]